MRANAEREQMSVAADVNTATRAADSSAEREQMSAAADVNAATCAADSSAERGSSAACMMSVACTASYP